MLSLTNGTCRLKPGLLMLTSLSGVAIPRVIEDTMRLFGVGAMWSLASLAAVPAAPASAQVVMLAELDGAAIESRTIRQQTVRTGGVDRSGRFQSDLEVFFGPGHVVRIKQTTTWHGPDGRGGPMINQQAPLRIGTPKVAMNRGGGYRLAVFLDGTLTFMRTYRQGGYKIEIRLARAADGLTCTSRETYLRELGADSIAMDSLSSGRPAVVVSSKQISSACRLIKR
jgi:hypothetical protein